MADAHKAAHGAIPNGQNHFSDAEWQAYRADDLDAARHIIYLMAGIFSLGIVLYSVICYIVAS